MNQYSSDPETLPVWFSRQARAAPHLIAATFGNTSLTYGELDAKSNQLARHLRESGVGLEQTVGIFLERSVELLVALLGVLKSGAAYLPLDPDAPPARLELMIDDARPARILTVDALFEKLPPSARELSTVSWTQTLARECSDALNVTLLPDQLAYVVFTSGSTGRPKGAMNTHRGMFNLFQWGQRVYPLTSDDRVLQKTSLSFDMSVLELFWPLVAGARVVFTLPGEHRDAQALARRIRTDRISVACFVPSLMRDFFQQGGLESCQSVRRFLFSGEALTADLVAALHSNTNAEVVNLYGPTEAAVEAASWTCSPQEQRAPPIGVPIDQMQLHILNADGHPVPMGEEGEICLGGVQLARGYLHRSDLTAEVFVPSPFGSPPGARLYRTGDLGRLLPNGALEYLGRKDHQVKLRGIRIELEEIESILRAHPAVSDAAVSLGKDARGEGQLRAHIAPHWDETTLESENQRQVDQWASVYDALYRSNTNIWNSAFTQTSLPQTEMRAWLDEAVDRILGSGVRDVLELGCGTGAVLFRVAPSCTRYVASDVSPIAVEQVRAEAERLGLDHVAVFQGQAHALSSVPDESFDVVVLNSVVQAFPSARYLQTVLHEALKKVRPGGRVFVGDVRHLGLQRTIASAIEVVQAESGLPKEVIRQRVDRRILDEEELLLAPGFFHDLVTPSGMPVLAKFLVKSAAADNELTQFRGDVLLLPSRGDVAPLQGVSIDFDAVQEGGLPSIEGALRDRAAWVRINRVPNARIGWALEIERRLLEERGSADFESLSTSLARRHARDEGVPGSSFEWAALGSRFGYRVELSWSAGHPEGAYDVLFFGATVTEAETYALHHQTRAKSGSEIPSNDPLFGRRSLSLVSPLRTHLRERLPEVMVPSAFIFLPALPRNASGKLDRKALPPPLTRASSHQEALPRNEMETLILRVWADVLGQPGLGIHDDFFLQGGHSLLATQVVTRLSEPLGTEIPLPWLFEVRTVAALAEKIEHAALGRLNERPAMRRLGRTEHTLSFAQERFWFLERIGRRTTDHVSFGFRLEGTPDVDALESALREIEARHEVLRTRFEEREGRPVALVQPSAGIHLRRAFIADETALKVEIDRASDVAFDLEKGPVWEAVLFSWPGNQHVLWIRQHHIVSDGWSMAVWTRELNQILVRKERLSPLEFQYGDFAQWEREWLTETRLDAELNYWREQLKDVPKTLSLPRTHSLSSPQPPRGVLFEWDEALTASLEELCRQEGVTLFMALMTAFQTLLYRYSGQEDFIVGTPFALRSPQALESMIGLFINTVVIRGQFEPRQTFRQSLQRCRRTALDAYAHREVPFEKVVQALQPSRQSGLSPLVQVMFALHNIPSTPISLPGVKAEPYDVFSTAGVFDLDLSFERRGSRLRGWLVFSTQSFDRDFGDRFVEQLRALVGAAVRNPEWEVERLPLLSSDQRDGVLALSGPRTQRPATKVVPTDLLALLSAGVLAHPQKVAVEQEGVRVTYADLEERSNRWAHSLRQRGVGLESVVGLYSPASPEVIVAMLGVLKAGGACLPLDPLHPKDRIRQMAMASGASVILARTGLDGSVFSDTPVLLLEQDLPQGEESAAPVRRPESLAFVLYTSGSTGVPKGVMISDRALESYTRFYLERIQLTARDRILDVASVGFDTFMEDFAAALSTGACLVLKPEHLGAESLTSFMENHEITLADLPSALWHAWVRSPSFRRAGPTVRLLNVGGEVLAPDALARWRQTHPPEVRFLNAYGPTETTVIASFFEVTDNAWDPLRPVPIGVPNANTRLYVLSPALELCPVGVPGELFIGGEGVGRGYLHQPAQTAKTFLPDPYAEKSVPGARMYRTGDLARWLPDGTLEFRGRRDGQIKIRGYRIEPAEIEAQLAQIPGVDDCTVQAVGERDGLALVAYWVGGSLQASQLRETLRAKLPSFMVPTGWVQLPVLPLTPNGKVNRAALPLPSSLGFSDAEYVPPRTELEATLCEIWEKVLSHEQLSVRDNFFDLGGHSLLATQVVAQIEHRLGREVPLRTLFEQPTIEALAKSLERVEATPKRATRPLRAERASQGQLSFAQERLWFMEKLEPGRQLYHAPEALRLRGPLDVDALKRALLEIVRRHEVLRTHFEEHAGLPIQVVAPLSPALSVPFRYLRKEEGQDAAQAASEILLAETAQPFDLSQGPMWRSLLIELGPNDHLLVVAQHHIASDGWSHQVFLEELSHFYSSPQRPLADLPVQYLDYARWQRERLTGAALEGQVEYWRKTLNTAPDTLNLPTDFVRPARASFEMGEVSFEWDPQLTQAVEQMCRAENVTLFMGLLTAFEVLLHRYSKQSTILVGTPVANRTHPALEPMLGFFVNTLVLRSDLAPEQTFRELLHQTKITALEAFAHQDVPFEQLVQALRPARHLNRAPLVQAMFALQNIPRREIALSGLDVSEYKLPPAASEFELTLTMEMVNGRLKGTLEYSLDVYRKGFGDRLAEQLRSLIEKAVAAPDTQALRLPLLGEGDQRALNAFNRTERTNELDIGVPQLFERQAVLSPEVIALEQEGICLTYAELDRRTNQWARYLRSQGVGLEQIVAVHSARSIDSVVAILGVLKAGGAYLPLDPAYPEQRLRFMIRDSGARHLITGTESTLGDLAEGLVIHRMDTPEVQAQGARSLAVEVRIPNEALAYVMYTSGSTGTPKGVLVCHRSLSNFLRHGRRFLSPTEGPLEVGHRILQFSSLSFDASLEETFSPLTAGATVVFRNDDMLRGSVSQFLAVCDGWNIQTLMIPTAYFDEVVEALRRGEAVLPARVRKIIIGGERMAPERLRTWLQLSIPDVTLLNVYGPTETTVFATVAALRTPPAFEVSIGRPLSNVRAYVLDDGLQPTPIGVPGELYLAGEGVGRGYQGQPPLTAEKFLPDPFSRTDGARMYRTGDLARWLPEGELEFLGRMDDQIKLRGHRIELGEIETCLLRHPAVRGCCVILQEERTGPVLVAYWVGENISPADLRAHLKKTVPAFMIPAVWRHLPQLPRAVSGKVDKARLPKVEASPLKEQADPQSPTEQMLASLWTSVLPVQAVNVDDDFFAVGGHSLLAAQFISRLSALKGKKLPVRWLFESPTLAQLARRLDEDLSAEAPLLPLSPTPPPVDVGMPRPLSYAQQRLWFVEQLISPPQALYNITCAWRLTGALDVTALASALTELSRSHHVLRTHFEERDGEPVQRVDPVRPVPIRQVKLHAGSDPEAELARIAAEDEAAPFDLRQGPLWRVTLVELAVSEHVLLLTQHHIISDGWSLSVFWKDLARLYAGEVVDPPQWQYADYAAWERRELESHVVDSQTEYWRGALKDAPTTVQWQDFAHPPQPSYRGKMVRLEWDERLTQAIEQMCQAHGVTLFMGLMTAFQIAIYRHSRQDDLLVGTPVARRHHPALEGMLGLLLNTLVIRGKFKPKMTFQEALAQTKQTTLEAFAHQDLPFERLVQAISTSRDFSRAPLVQVMFALQNTPSVSAPWRGLEVEPYSTGTQSAAFDLFFSMEKVEGRLKGELTFSLDLFEQNFGDDFLEELETLLRGATAKPQTTLDRLPIVGELQQQKLLPWQRPLSREPLRTLRNASTLHGCFEQQAAKTPNAIALECDGVLLTYEELDARSNQWARRLRGMGLGPEDVVGLYAERRVETLVALLGILKSGAAYLPLEPAYPKDRLLWMVQDAQARVVVGFPDSGNLEWSVPTLRFDDATVQTLSGTSLTPTATGAHLAYVIYTSGSTGVPKGVMIEHAHALRLFRASGERFDFRETDVFALFHSLSFDFSVWELWIALLFGGKLVWVPSEATRSPELLLRLFIHSQVTVASQTPTVFAQLQAEMARNPGSEQKLALRQLYLAGEALNLEQLTGWYKLRGPERTTVVNAYGPTEITVFISFAEVQWPVHRPIQGSLIGTPMTHGTLHILDALGQPVPIGVPGEVCIGGTGLGRGYLRRPELTAEKFVPDPFAQTPGARLYRSGDLARRRPSGEVEYLGRIDEQVKLRGYRIELGEIEAAVMRHPAVQSCAVRMKGEGVRKQLVAYWVGERVDASELRAMLLRELPSYMVPSAWMRLDKLPVTVNGKLDARALPDPQPLPRDDAYVSPKTSTQQRLVELWEKELQVEKLGIRDDFFDVGGHSLLAIRLVSSIRSVLGAQLPVAALFEFRTVERLAEALDKGEGGLQSPLVPLQAEGEAPPFFCVHPIGGTVYCYAPLAAKLGRQQPFFGLQSTGSPANIEAMAALYLKTVQKAQGEGSLSLGGWSLGGVIAREMALQFEAQGGKVDLLFLIDPTEVVLRALRVEEGPSAEEELRRRFESDLLALPGVEPNNASEMFSVFKRNWKAYQTYQPKERLRCPVVVILSEDAVELDWSQLSESAVSVERFSGDHYALLKEPLLGRVAERLSEALRPAATPPD